MIGKAYLVVEGDEKGGELVSDGSKGCGSSVGVSNGPGVSLGVGDSGGLAVLKSNDCGVDSETLSEGTGKGVAVGGEGIDVTGDTSKVGEDSCGGSLLNNWGGNGEAGEEGSSDSGELHIGGLN